MISKSINKFMMIAIFLAITLLTAGVASAETASYSSSYETPYCDSGDEVCEVPNTLIGGAGDDQSDETEPNYYNTLYNICDGEKGENDAELYVNSMTITGQDGPIKPGDTIEIETEFLIDSFEDIKIGFFFSENPNDANPTWTKIDEKNIDLIDDIDLIDEGFVNFTTTKTLPSSGGEYAIRANIEPDSYPEARECADFSRIKDNDDVVITAIGPYEPNTEPASQVYLDTAMFNGNITVNNIEEDLILAYYQYREEGTTTWTNTTKQVTNVTTSNSYSTLETGMEENTTYEYNLCIQEGEFEDPICDDENQKVKTLERPTITIDETKAINNSAIEVTATINRNDATAGQPIYEYNATGTVTGTNEKSNPEKTILFENEEDEEETITLTYDTESIGYGNNNVTITEEYWIGDPLNNSQEYAEWGQSQYEAPFQRTTTAEQEIEEPTITITTIQTTDYDTVEWQAEIKTNHETEYEITIIDPVTEEEEDSQTGTVDEDQTLPTKTVEGLDSNKTYIVKTKIGGEEQETTTITTEEREEPQPYLESDNLIVNTYDKVKIENLEMYNGDYWGEFDIYADVYKDEELYKETLLETITTSESQTETTTTFLQTGENVTGLEPDTTYEILIRTIPQQDTSIEATSTTQTITTEEAQNPEIKDGNITDKSSNTLTHESNLTSLGTANELSPYLQVREKNNPENEIIITPNGIDTEKGYIKIIKEGSSYFLEKGENITEPTTIEAQAYQLDSDTEYEARMCVESDEWNTMKCTDYDTERTLEQGVEGVKTLSPTRNYDGGITLRGETEHLHEARNVKGWFQIEHMESGNVTNTTKFDIEEAGTHSHRIENLSYETKYEYQFYVEMQVERNEEQITLESKGGWESFTTNVEKSIDNIWSSLLEGSEWAKIIMGIAITLSTLFVGVSAFGKTNMQLGTYGIMILLFIGALLSTIIGLFPTYILLLFIIGGVVLAILKGMLFSGRGEE